MGAKENIKKAADQNGTAQFYRTLHPFSLFLSDANNSTFADKIKEKN
jgi:hypothetical protein